MDNPAWWRSAVIYQIYLRSFADANGDGIGDIAGARSRLGYLRDLGVDAIWFTPWYVSPLADGGYDVADYRAVDPAFGTLAEAEGLIAEAAELGIRTIVDIVPNHVSDQHRWFQAALAAGPGSPERARFWFRPGRGPNGDEMPTQWSSHFWGPTWTRTVEPDGRPGEWYLHLFSPEQPDLNWDHPDVRREHEEILSFWFDRGVAGIRIDSAALLVKDPELPEVPAEPGPGNHPNIDRDGLHDIYRSWRAIADSYPGTRILVGEIWLPDPDRFALYLRPDELHAAFNFDFLVRPWDAVSLRESIDTTLAAHAPVGAPATWVLSNHDVTRPVTRYGQPDTAFSFAAKRPGIHSDLDLGLRRARAAALLAAALPGSLYVYQGEELGLDEVEDLPPHQRLDPMHLRSGGTDPGRDGCRVPLPWSGTGAPFGFSPEGAVEEPWLRQPDHWAALTAAAQREDPGSTLNLYRAALRIRHLEPGLGDGPMEWLSTPPDVLGFARGARFVSISNLSGSSLTLPADAVVLLASQDVSGGALPPDASAWLRLERPVGGSRPLWPSGGAGMGRRLDRPPSRRHTLTFRSGRASGENGNRRGESEMTAASARRTGMLGVMALAIVSLGACNAATTTPGASSAGASAGPGSSASAVAHKPVTISVGVLRPGATQEAADALNLQIDEFQAKYPWITVQSEEYNWTAPTFTAALAAGTLPDVFTIPFTDGKGLIAQHQIVNIDARVRALPYVDKFNKSVLVNGQDADGKIWAVPIAAYGMSLTYNRTLFTQAGLDPDKPPTTWDEVKADAKIIADKTHQAGFAEMATQNTGGWQLTTMTYALGGRMESVGSDGKVTATVKNPATKQALAFLHDLRWGEDSMGATFDYAWPTINQAFASGQIGMFTGGSDLYTAMVQNNNLTPADYGVTTIPLASDPNAGVLGGGTLAAVNVNTTEDQRDAAVTWIDWYYMNKLLTQEGAVADAQALKANNQPVGVPALPIFDKATYDQSQTWIKDYINVPTAQMTGFTSKIFDQQLVNEPTSHTQDLYAALDPVVQAVLTDKNANVDSLLDAANKQIQAILDQG